MVSSLKKMKLIAISATMSLLLAAMLACNIGGEADAPAAEPMASEPIKFGMILVGPRNDRGWSQAHHDGGAYAAQKTGSEMIVMDFINPADSPDITVAQVVDQMVEQGAELIFATSEDMKDGILELSLIHI